jgi:hypothetical protein
MDSKYPLVEYLDNGGGAHFARTFNWTSTAVQTGSTLLATDYTLPAGVTNGAYRVQVVTNGIASQPVLNILMDSTLSNVTLKMGRSIFFPTYDVYSGSTLLSRWFVHGFSAVDVTMKGTGGTVNILSTPAGIPVNVYAAGSATANIGDASSLAGIQGPVNLENPPSFSTVNIDDRFDRAARTVTLSTVPHTTITEGSHGLFGQLSGLAPATITWKYADTSQVTILGGTGGNTWNVKGTSNVTNLVASGDDTVNVTSAGSVQGIFGTLNIENPAFSNTITIDGSGSVDSQAQTVVVSTLGTNPLDFSGGGDTWGQISGLAPGVINYEYADTASVTVHTGLSPSTVVNVQGTGSPPTWSPRGSTRSTWATPAAWRASTAP